MEGRGRRVKTPSTRLVILREKRDEKWDVQDQDAPHSKSAEEKETAVPPVPPKRKLNCEHENSNKKAPPQCADLPSTHPSTLEDTNPPPLCCRRIRIYRG